MTSSRIGSAARGRDRTGSAVGVLATAALLLYLLLCASSLTTISSAAGDANISGCPFAEASPGFRSFLPDCRAYELVSPSYGAGAIAAGPANEAPPMTANGEHLLAVSFGAMAETEELEQNGFEYGAVYEFSRTPTGWITEAQDPPPSLYPWRSFEGFSTTELGRSLWQVAIASHPGEENEDRADEYGDTNSFVIREPEGEGRASFAIVGPLTAPGHEPLTGDPSIVRGRSADLSHIVFTVKAEGKQLWPGDTTREELYEKSPGSIVGRFVSLYEYRGTAGGEPVLVGVKNEGAPPWRAGAAHVNEGAQLASECGTAFDAISASGERVFFTAEHAAEDCAGSGPAVNELYARVNGSETVDISEPTTGPGGDCQGCKESDPEAAVFAGASEDGSRVFFTSEQELLAGATGKSLYEYDFDAAKRDERLTLVAPNVTEIPELPPDGIPVTAPVASISKDGSHVYFESKEALTSASEPNGNGEVATLGSANLYVAEATSEGTPKPKFVASGEGAETFETTHDGQFFVFKTATDLRGTDDSSNVPQLFEYDAQTGTLVRVSVGQRAPGGYECEATQTVQEGYDCDGNTYSAEDSARLAEIPNSSLAKDGTVVFTSELPLTPGAVQGHKFIKENGATLSYAENVYEYRANQVYLISPGDEATPAAYKDPESETRLFGIDESGRDVFFSSTDSLVPQDTDTQSSWYDAREEGGFPAPASYPGCAGEACQGPLPPAPLLPSAASALTTAGDNPSLPSATTVAPKPRTAAQIRAEKLAKALKACKRKSNKHRRAACEKEAREKFGPPKKAKKANRGSRS